MDQVAAPVGRTPPGTKRLHTFCTACRPPPTACADNVPGVAANHIDRLGPFALDRHHRRLSAEGRPITIAQRHMDVLLVLAATLASSSPRKR